MKLLTFIAVVFVGCMLLAGISDFPVWGDPHSPASTNEISVHYITQIEKETKVPNLVTAVLADYRGYDTMFETVVVFVAGVAIIAVLGLVPINQRSEDDNDLENPVKGDIIVIQTCRVLIPIIQLFALYVVAHGHHSPGGGFQGGVIFGASLILMAIARDLPTTLRRLSARRAVVIAGIGIVIYAGFGIAAMTQGGNFLDYGTLDKLAPESMELTSVMARYHSMLGVEIGVALTVASIMFAIYAYLSTQGKLKGGL